MRRFKSSFLLVTVVAVCLAQTAVERESPAVNRVASKLACSCGCNLNMACKMEPWPCHMCRPAKEKIFQMQAAGKSDAEILDVFVQENGRQVLIEEPGVLGLLSHYAAIPVGLLLIWMFYRKYRSKPRLAAAEPVQDEQLDRYRDSIEKDLAKLD